MQLGFGLGLGFGGANPEAAIRALFAAGEQGGWWDPSDFSTMFQDSAGTTPVTATGQPVGLHRDKSGRSNHRAQPTAAARPTLQQDASGFYHLLYDGVDDFMQTANVNLASTTITVGSGVRKLSDVTAGLVLESSVDSSVNNGVFNLSAPQTIGAATFGFRSGGTLKASSISAASFAAPFSSVLVGQGDITNDITTLRGNGVQIAASASDQGTGSFGNFPIYSGSRAGTTAFFNGREYQTVVRAAASSAGDLVLLERFIGAKMGLAL